MAGPGTILLRFKRRGLELTSGAHDITLEAPRSEKLQGVLQSYGEWEWASLHPPDGNEAEGSGESGNPASQDPTPGLGNGQGSTPESLRTEFAADCLQTGNKQAASDGASVVPQATEVVVGQRRPVSEVASQHWERLNFLPEGLVVYLNPEATPRQARLKNGHRLWVIAKKVKPSEEAQATSANPAPSKPGAGASPALLALESHLTSHGKQQADVLCSEMQMRLTLAPPASTDPPTPAHAPAASSPQTPADLSTLWHAPIIVAASPQTPAASAPGEAQSGSSAGYSLEEKDQATGDVCSRGPSLSGSDSLGGQASSRAGDMLDDLDHALAFMRAGEEAFLQAGPLGAAVEYTKGLLLLEGATEDKEEVSGKMRILVEDMKQQLLVCRATEYFSMSERAQGREHRRLYKEIACFRIRSGLRLMESYPQVRSGYLHCACSWSSLRRFNAALEVLSQGEAKMGAMGFQEMREMLLDEARDGGAVVLGAGPRRREALEQALEEQRVWEASAEEDADWLQRLSLDGVSARVLSERLPSDEATTGRAFLYRHLSQPVKDVFPLLLYSDMEVVRIETDPALASKDSFLRRLARASLPRGLYGEQEPTPEVEQGRSSRRGRGKKKKGGTSRPQQEPGVVQDPAPAHTASDSVAGPGESSRQRVLARNLELARRCNMLGNRDAAAGSMLGAAQWYTRGLLLAFPQAWATSCGALNAMQAETGPPGTKALALALLWSRSMAYSFLCDLAGPLVAEGAPDTLREMRLVVMQLPRRATADAVWCAYYGGGWLRGAMCLGAVLQSYRGDFYDTILEGEVDTGAPGAQQLRYAAAELREGESSGRLPPRGPELLSACQSAIAGGGLLENDFAFLAALHPKLESALGGLAAEARARGEL